MAGDLVNRGAERDDWDSLFYNAQGVWTHRPVMPTIGNHECQGGKPKLYLKEFTLPENGPKGIEPEHAYSFEYGNALFVVLDGNLAPSSQAAWLEQKLSQTHATWKFVMYHQPAYSSGGNRDNVELRAAWTPLFDKYHVDMALQGHDHAYLRTYPMRGGQRAASPKEGTVYVIAVSGTKLYAQPKHDYTEFGMAKLPTFQVLGIQTNPNRLTYRAYDGDVAVRDELVIEK
jgi:3',5'-cyclic AMP phosphodiesterase CpdA